MNTVILEKFDIDILNDYKLPIITIYDNPKDYPNKFVARLFNINKPTEYAIIKDTLEEIRKCIPIHMSLFRRYPYDDEVIVETYI